MKGVVVTSLVPVKANSGVTARVPAAGKVLEGDVKPTLLREDQHYLHYITITLLVGNTACNLDVNSSLCFFSFFCELYTLNVIE